MYFPERRFSIARNTELLRHACLHVSAKRNPPTRILHKGGPACTFVDRNLEGVKGASEMLRYTQVSEMM